MTSLLGRHFGPWRHRADQFLAQHPDGAAAADDLLAAADRAEMAAIHARQAANKHVAYERRRPSRYANARYDLLRADQDPQAMVSSWWTRGPRVLTLAGPSRTGKTTAAYAIANDAHHSQAWVVAWTASDLSAALKPDGDDTAYDHAANCDLLLVDDLGRERTTDWWREQLQRLLDVRCANEQRLVVTANTPPEAQRAYEALVERYDDPIVERLFDGGGIVVFDGPAQRQVVTKW